MKREFVSHSEEDTERVGRELAGIFGPVAVVSLQGQLGAGKTAFVRGLAGALGIAEAEVSSPTFALVHEYGERGAVIHIDLYRLQDETAAQSVGLDEIWDRRAVVLVEWGDRFPKLLPPGHWTVEIAYGPGESDREISVRGGASGR